MSLFNSPQALLTTLLFLSTLFTTAQAYVPQQNFVVGTVYARGVIRDENGLATYVTYDQNGKEGKIIGKVDTPEREDARVISVSQAQAVVEQYLALKTLYPDSELLSRQAYAALTEPDNRPDIDNDSYFILVRGLAQRQLMSTGSQLILQQSRINPEPSTPYHGKSLLISKQGEILAQSDQTIGLRASFLKDSNNNPVYGYQPNWKRQGYIATNPLKNLPVKLGQGIIGQQASITDEQGQYSLRYRLFCPGFSFEWTIPVIVELQYRSFNPRGKTWFPYYYIAYQYTFCSGLSQQLANSTSLLGQMAYTSILATEQQRSIPLAPLDIPIDIVILSGSAAFENITLSPDDTRYDSSRSSLVRIAQEAQDLDNDGIDELMKTGELISEIDPDTGEEISYFKSLALDKNPPLQGIWLSSEHDLSSSGTLDTNITLPSYTRLLDWNDDFEDRALLSSISEQDLQNTDLYLIREADGSLITERRGIKSSEYKTLGQLKTWEGEFKYTLPIINNREGRNRTGSQRHNSFEDWQIASNMNPDLYKRNSNHLRVGEYVKLIAINRATGYMGSVRTPIKAAGAEGNTQQLSFDIPTLIMRPPNLKIMAERRYIVQQGFTKGDSRTHTIGNEGAALSSDKSIIISTEWLDHDGSPLPDILEDNGYTGRLAKVSAPNSLTSKTGFSSTGPSVSHFAIKPGLQTQIITLPEEINAAEHLYIHVSGEPKKRRPNLGTKHFSERFSGNFDSNPALYKDNEILKYRPSKFVPVKVAIYDETRDKEQLENWTQYHEDHPDSDLEKPQPYYRWVYRPEFQVSIYQLKVNEIRRISRDKTEPEIDIYLHDQPLISASDSALELLFNLTEPEFPALKAYSYGDDNSEQGNNRELIVGMGEHEVKAIFDQNQNIRFSHLGDISHLDAEDFLLLKLYSNNDSSNTLWEWATEYLAIDSLQDIEEQIDEDGVIHLSADHSFLDLQAVLYGYADRDPANKKPVHLSWKITGDGIITTPHQINHTDGVFNTKLIMPTRAGAKATIRAVLNGNSVSTDPGVVFGTVVVDPGPAVKISSVTVGNAGIGQSQDLQITGSVSDIYNNPVADGTPIRISIQGQALQIQSPATPNNTNQINANTLLKGEFKATITGGEFASTDNTIDIQVGNVNKSIPFTVKPIQISISPESTQHSPNHIDSLSIKVSDAQGNPMVGTDVDVVSDAGLVINDYLVTDQSGMVQVQIKNLPYPKLGTLSARVGYSGYQELPYQVRNPISSVGTGPENSLDSQQALLVGDQLSRGIFNHARYDNVDIDYSYNTTAPVTVHGLAAESKTLSLGTLSHPNRMPLLNYSMSRLSSDAENNSAQNSLAPDENGVSHALAQNIHVVQDHPLGAGHSYHFSQAQTLLIKSLPSITDNTNTNSNSETTSSEHYDQLPTAQQLNTFSAAEQTQITLAIKITDTISQAKIARTLLHIGQEGGQRISLNPDNSLSYTITTATGQYQVSSHRLSPTIEHQVSAEYSQNQITLTVDGQQNSTATSSFLLYRDPTDLTLVNNTAATLTDRVKLTALQLSTTGSQLSNQHIDKLKRATNTGFRVDLKIEQNNAEAQIIQFDSEAYSVTLDTLNQIHYQIQTDQGAISLTSEPLNPNQWYTLAGQYNNNTLTLEINGKSYTTPATGNIQYSDDDQLIIGQHFNGHLNSLKFFDYTSVPLVTFANDQEKTQITLDSSGQHTLQVKSTGQLNSQPGENLAMLSIAITEQKNQNQQNTFINLVSSEMYQQLAGHYIDFIAEDAPPLNTAYLNNPYQNANNQNINHSHDQYQSNPYRQSTPSQALAEQFLNSLIRPAHAGAFMDVASQIWSVVNWIIPLEDIGIMSKQLYYLGTNNPDFDPVELSLSSLGVLSIIPLPPTKALKAVSGVLRKGIKWMSDLNPKFIKAFASVIGRIASQALTPVKLYIKNTKTSTLLWNGADGLFKKVNLDAVINVAPFIIIIADLLKDEEGRKSLGTLIKSVQSDDDLWAWIDYLRLPTEGWTGDSLPPVNFASLSASLDLQLAQNNNQKLNIPLWYQSIASNPLALLVSDAHAIPSSFTKLAPKIKQLLTSSKHIANKDLIKAIKTTTEVMKNITLKAPRKLAHNKAFIRTATKISTAALTKVLRTAKKMRTNPIILIAAVAYLESRKECDDTAEKINGNCFKHTEAIYTKNKIDKLEGIYKLSFFTAHVNNRNPKGIAANIDGQFFHIVYWAYRHMLYELGVGPQVLQVEQTYEEMLKPKLEGVYKSTTKREFGHQLDLVLAGPSGGKKPYIGIELKSWSLGPLEKRMNGKSYNPAKKWKGGTIGTAHKQFFYDRVALLKNKKILYDIKWKLQDWAYSNKKKGKKDPRSSPLKGDIDRLIRHRLAQLPTKSKQDAIESLGYQDEKESIKEGKIVAKKINLFNAKNEIIDNAKDLLNGGLEDIMNELEQELAQEID